MRKSITVSILILVTSLSGCDLRSETAKSEMEKFNGTPTPTIAPTPTEAPIDPADVVQVDISVQGEMINVSGRDLKRSVSCSKFNRVMINGSNNVITIKGGCRQISINGGGNQIISDAALEFTINGAKNKVIYSRFVNGKRPVIKDSAAENTIEKVTASEAKK